MKEIKKDDEIHIPKVYGYIRVSTEKQDLTRQRNTIYEFADKNNIEIEKIFEDKKTGLNFNREQYQELVNNLLEKDDTVIIASLDRLGRNKEELKKQINIITKKRKAKLIIVNSPLLTNGINKEITDSTTKLVQELTFNLLFEFLTTMAEFEVNEKKDRIKNGIDNMEVRNGKKWSRKTKKFTGRPSIFEKINKDEVINYIQKGLKSSEITKLLNIKTSTFYKIKNILKEENLI